MTWQAGDLALCINVPHHDLHWSPVVGSLYSVRDVLVNDIPAGRFNDTVFLELTECMVHGVYWASSCFIKITPGAVVSGEEVERRVPVGVV